MNSHDPKASTNDQTELADDQRFDAVFKQTLADLEARARAVGMTWNSLCKEAGIARATPDRWRANSPKTVELVTKMQTIVAEAEANGATHQAARTRRV